MEDTNFNGPSQIEKAYTILLSSKWAQLTLMLERPAEIFAATNEQTAAI